MKQLREQVKKEDTNIKKGLYINILKIELNFTFILLQHLYEINMAFPPCINI